MEVSIWSRLVVLDLKAVVMPHPMFHVLEKPHCHCLE